MDFKWLVPNIGVIAIGISNKKLDIYTFLCLSLYKIIYYLILLSTRMCYVLKPEPVLGQANWSLARNVCVLPQT